MDFQLLSPKKIIFQRGAVLSLGNLFFRECKRPLLITGGSSLKRSGNLKKILDSLHKEGFTVIEYQGVNGEPTCEVIDTITDFAKDQNIDSVIAIGGGTVIDVGKAVAGLVVNQPGVENYLEGVGTGLQLTTEPLPFVAIPTTSGTGAEATKNSVIRSFVKEYKKSFRDERLIADLVIVDPELTLSLPIEQSVICGMDAICQLIESYTTKKQNPFTQALCKEYIPRAIEAIEKVYKNPLDIDARTIMSQASLASGIALANSGLGAIHGFASGIGGIFDVPHGAICGVLLPGICEINSKLCPSKYSRLASLINRDNSNDISMMISRLYELNDTLQIPKDFSTYNIDKNNASKIVAKSQGSSMSGNCSQLETPMLVEFVRELL